jgi:hypothetical protein
VAELPPCGDMTRATGRHPCPHACMGAVPAVHEGDGKPLLAWPSPVGGAIGVALPAAVIEASRWSAGPRGARTNGSLFNRTCADE